MGLLLLSLAHVQGKAGFQYLIYSESIEVQYFLEMVVYPDSIALYKEIILLML